MKLTFNEVKELFKVYQIWSGDKELLWYQKAWKVLDKGGLTEYRNYIEKRLVIIRAFTLIMIYGEFCELAFNECFNYEFPDWQYHTGLNAFMIGEIVGTMKKLLPEYDDKFWAFYYYRYGYEDGYSWALDDIFKNLVLSQRDEVFECLTKNIGSGRECGIYASMYLASIFICEDLKDKDNKGNFQNDDIEELSEYEKYEKEIEKYYWEILKEGEGTEALNWVIDGTYKIHS
ncbi:MAG TPA: hypothetical protein GXX37_15555 [Clostridiaceae bacterium]|nr:hypothetical protein [Clostridiaceae bacterium]